MSSLLTPEIMAFVGNKTKPQRELVTRRDIRKYAVATSNRQKKYLNGDEAPPMFHWHLFWDVVELEDLSNDGVNIDSLLPNLPLFKAMAGGVDFEYLKPIFPGDWLIAIRTLTNIYEKKGRSGDLIFYEVLMEITNDKGDLVIRDKRTTLMR